MVGAARLEAPWYLHPTAAGVSGRRGYPPRSTGAATVDRQQRTTRQPQGQRPLVMATTAGKSLASRTGGQAGLADGLDGGIQGLLHLAGLPSTGAGQLPVRDEDEKEGGEAAPGVSPPLRERSPFPAPPPTTRCSVLFTEGTDPP